MELYYGIILMKKIPGMPGTSPELPGIPGESPEPPGPSGIPRARPATQWGRPLDPLGHPQGPHKLP